MTWVRRTVPAANPNLPGNLPDIVIFGVRMPALVGIGIALLGFFMGW